MPRRQPPRAAANEYRKWVVQQLRPLLPSRWKLQEYRVKPDAIDTPTVFVTLQRVARLPESPMRKHIVTYTITLVEPAADPSDADALLDDELVDLLHYLDELKNEHGFPVLRWTGAERVVAGPDAGYQGVDITVEIITSAKSNDTTKE